MSWLDFSGGWMWLTPGILLIIFSCLMFLGLKFVSKGGYEEGEQRPISVIVAARNEFENLGKFLEPVLNQVYREYEVIVVIDRCDDQSPDLLATKKRIYPHLRTIEITSLPEGWTGKKYAIHCGVEAARFEYLAFTDADCEVGPGWLKEINKAFGKDSDVVLGISPYRRQKGGLNLFVRFETLVTAVRYISAAGWGFPFMAVGRNLAYRKSFYRESGGMEVVKDRVSGDDDLIVNRGGKGKKVSVMLNTDSFVYSEPPADFASWIRQKLRHLHAGRDYRPGTKALLGLLHFFHAIFYLSLAIVLWNHPAWQIAGGIYLVWLMMAITVHVPNARKWNSTDLIFLYPVLDLVYMLYISIAGPAGLILKPKWK